MKIIGNMFDVKNDFYNKVFEWVLINPTHTFYLFSSQQSDSNFYDFCSAVVDANKIPVLLTNVGAFNARYPLNLRMAMSLSNDVRVYEVAKMGMDVVLDSKADLFIKTNGGILWIQ
jgi:hypothetical protein